MILSETALSTPEILSLIFAKAPRQTQAACALVCKKWSEISLNELWRDLEDIIPLLRLVMHSQLFYDRETGTSMHDVGLSRFKWTITYADSFVLCRKTWISAI